jgi:NAD(P)-dependent dehydrogenase (short-subunit alcohol dehydrogenase family)
MGHLTGRCAIVTGAAYGIGFAAAERLAMEGARVVIADIKGHEAAAERLSVKGLDAIAIKTDVTDLNSVSALIRAIIARHARIDILVNNAAISAELRPAPFEQSSPEEWRRIYEVNVIGVFNMCKAVSPHIRRRKRGVSSM